MPSEHLTAERSEVRNRPLRPQIRPLALTISAALALALASPVAAIAATATPGDLVVAAGQTVTIATTTAYRSVTIADGGALVTPAGHSLTLTVNGVETGSRITETGGTETAIVPGRYRGRVVLSVTAQNLVPWQTLQFPFRQAVYVGADGLEQDKSVPAAVSKGKVGNNAADGVTVKSTGEAFNGVYVNGRNYTLNDATIKLDGNGRSDFVGYGAAIVATGGKRVVVDDATIRNKGVVRTGIVADGGTNLVVKNSSIRTEDGTLPAGYQSTVDLAYMQQAPWMLGIEGNVRATNLVGANTQASYINSKIYSEGWGVLSVDTGSNMKLTSINSTLTTGEEGYGSYAIGGTAEEFLGSKLNVDTYAAINRGGTIHYGDSSKTAVSALNMSLNLGLSKKELRSLAQQRTVINSHKWGVMWHGAGGVTIDGGTVVNTGLSTFLNKGQTAVISVDGSHGAKLNPGNGIVFQTMENDDPGPVVVNGKLVNAGTYTEPTTDPVKDTSFDVTAAHATDAVATFSDIALRGDFYNGMRGNQNLVLNFADGASVNGVISATQTKHKVSAITEANYDQIGVISNTTAAAVNNGVIVSLSGGSTWKVTGTSYLTKLTLSADSLVRAGGHGKVTMTVDGLATPIVPGHTYTGAIVITA